MTRREFRDLASLEEAHTIVGNLDIDPGSETVPLEAAGGRVLAERIDATIDVPGFARAGKDGYAVQARDTFGAEETDPAELDIVGEVHAGAPPDVVVGEGEAAEISTGAVMPEGADAVVMVERTEEAHGSVLVGTAIAPGDAVMEAGADIAAGERGLGPGTVLTAREIGLLSALGVDAVPVRGEPTVGIISTGDELVRPGESLRHEAGQIYDVNSYTIATAVEEAGGDPVVYPHAEDEREEMERVLREAADECDLVLSSGSTSASAVDVIYRVIEERGELLLHGVAVKPGKPMLVGRLDDSAYVGLPGFPVSALSIFRTFVAPAIREAAGRPEPQTASVDGTMAVRERYAEGRTRMLPVGLVENGAGDRLVYPVDKGSGATTSLVEADGFVEVDADTEYLGEGEAVTVTLFSPDVRAPRVLGVGEDDPALARLLDAVRTPRYLAEGTREGLRRLRDGIPDVAVAAGPLSTTPDAAEIARWTRDWGLVVPAGNPADVEGVESLIDDDLRFVNRGTNSGLRTDLDATLDALADDRDTSRHGLTSEIAGYERTVRAHESPARSVASGSVDVGLGLRSTADRLGLGFVPLGDQPVRVFVAEDRREKPGVRDLERALTDDLDAIVASLPGFEH
ncbi:MAG: molybdopterin biosynthesis protein [Halanaeroarchaeum sp.]